MIKEIINPTFKLLDKSIGQIINKSFIKKVGLVGSYGISIFIGYLMPNLFIYIKYMICK